LVVEERWGEGFEFNFIKDEGTYGSFKTSLLLKRIQKS
jgi:hypothetical protein